MNKAVSFHLWNNESARYVWSEFWLFNVRSTYRANNKKLFLCVYLKIYW